MLRSSACCRQENATFYPHILGTWAPWISRSLQMFPILMGNEFTKQTEKHGRTGPKTVGDESGVSDAVIDAEPPEVGGHVKVGVAPVVRTETVVANVGDKH